jgi:hypothetical protein
VPYLFAKQAEGRSNRHDLEEEARTVERRYESHIHLLIEIQIAVKGCASAYHFRGINYRGRKKQVSQLISFVSADAQIGSAPAKHCSLCPISMASQLTYYLDLIPTLRSSVLHSQKAPCL